MKNSAHAIQYDFIAGLQKVLPNNLVVVHVADKKSVHRQNCQKAMTLASQMRRHDKTMSKSDALQTAWDKIKENPSLYKFVHFTKTNGTESKRVIMTDSWTNYVKPQNSGRKLKDGLQLVCDAAKYLTNQDRPLISFYTNSIIEQF